MVKWSWWLANYDRREVYIPLLVVVLYLLLVIFVVEPFARRRWPRPPQPKISLKKRLIELATWAVLFLSPIRLWGIEVANCVGMVCMTVAAILVLKGAHELSFMAGWPPEKKSMLSLGFLLGELLSLPFVIALLLGPWNFMPSLLRWGVFGSFVYAGGFLGIIVAHVKYSSKIEGTNEAKG